jgi:adenylyl- and sulfurtransferase ThiI
MRDLGIKSDQREEFFRTLARNVKDGVKFSEPEK